jgi:uncharacterized protein YecE (DUF72 family)
MVVLCGTSGYNYEPWRGPFYPPDLPKSKMLAYYASRFDTVEINYSFYRRPTAKLLSGWAAQVPDRFRFALKAWQAITHRARLRDPDLVAPFADAARSLGPKLAPILYQLPPNLKSDSALLRDFLHHLPRDLPAAFEFRHESWFSEETFAALRDFGAALCIAESDELATPRIRTAPFGYLRLRKAEYDEAQLESWATWVRDAGFAQDVFCYFKHEDEARGPRFAEQFRRAVEAASTSQRSGAMQTTPAT